MRGPSVLCFPSTLVPRSPQPPSARLTFPHVAGKTTLLNEILRNREGLKVAIIVNDMSEINIDRSFVQVRRRSSSPSSVDVIRFS